MAAKRNANEKVDLMEDVRVTIELVSGEAIESRILTIFSVGEQDYIALLPVDENDRDDPSGTVYLYRYEEDADGNPSILNIESDEEYDAVSDAYDALPVET